ncbi:aldehyde dehydrogenase family protein [Nocardia terpenica]|uniref:aldehyde dehydrogenase family protein n=1 Tax=Nocardia terpenica TaxID=455432 RepID=UPI0018936A94|nr:aldehyde dehydrogenase family protein [Nocardia terpenica]MBF6066071.1 aldehyde dehydrogenase family protein [Nocardia terpenica]MBF6109238.1 aldehyde dehydrogenase family protein [Nocardia terpenica]MBF6116315.1 aldehyde dehydrogenase family protein [Nocardia terpenica]MBF6123472.1 aldehyde dehydrogenase family protein [Nocardia terpenica]MBF6156749.1 aldehyde dehydrogenase family protein [Nocardia terpenica]
MDSSDASVLLHYGGVSRMSLDRNPIRTIDGEMVGWLHEAPPLLVDVAIAALREVDDLPPDELLEGVAEASRLFGCDDLDGVSPDRYCAMLSAVSGAPVHIGELTLATVGSYGGALPLALRHQRPAEVGTVMHRGGVTAEMRWVPRGRVLTVIAPSNHPATYTLTMFVLACGYRVALRPGAADPYTGRRLVSAMTDAGLGDRIALLPTGHGTVDHLVRSADLALCFGGPQLVRRYARDPRVSVHGPGRSKVVTGTRVTADTLDYLEDAVAEGGGLRCMNISAVYTPDDPATVADALAHRLSRLPVLHPTDQNAVLPGVSMAEASAIDAVIRRYGPSVRDHSAPLYDDRTVEQVGPGSAVLRPRVLSVSTPTHPLIGTEHRFPFVVLAPWPAEAPVRVRMRLLRDTLVAVLLDDDEELSRAALADTSIRKVVVGPTAPWWTSPSLPHEGLLTQFLFDGKTLLTRSGAELPTSSTVE